MGMDRRRRRCRRRRQSVDGHLKMKMWIRLSIDLLDSVEAPFFFYFIKWNMMDDM